jgi:hypothetical protein
MLEFFLGGGNFFVVGGQFFWGSTFFGGLRGGFRVLACADTGSEDPPWCASIISLFFNLSLSMPYYFSPRRGCPRVLKICVCTY